MNDFKFHGPKAIDAVRNRILFELGDRVSESIRGKGLIVSLTPEILVQQRQYSVELVAWMRGYVVDRKLALGLGLSLNRLMRVGPRAWRRNAALIAP